MACGGQRIRLRLAVGDDLADGGAPGRVDGGDAALEPVGGGFDFAFVEEERAEIDGGLRVVGSDGESFAEAALGFLDVAAGLLGVAEIVEDFGGGPFFGGFGEKMDGAFVVSTVETFESCDGLIGWGHAFLFSAIAGGDRC